MFEYQITTRKTIINNFFIFNKFCNKFILLNLEGTNILDFIEKAEYHSYLGLFKRNIKILTGLNFLCIQFL